MAVAFLSHRAPLELTAATGLIALVLFGLLTPEQAFSGFSSPVTVTLFSMFALGAALAATGVTISSFRFCGRKK
jgi:di/tricarboxylate transporter